MMLSEQEQERRINEFLSRKFKQFGIDDMTPSAGNTKLLYKFRET